MTALEGRTALRTCKAHGGEDRGRAGADARGTGQGQLPAQGRADGSVCVHVPPQPNADPSEHQQLTDAKARHQVPLKVQ